MWSKVSLDVSSKLRIHSCSYVFWPNRQKSAPVIEVGGTYESSLWDSIKSSLHCASKMEKNVVVVGRGSSGRELS
jgi:hypothetical protein